MESLHFTRSRSAHLAALDHDASTSDVTTPNDPSLQSNAYAITHEGRSITGVNNIRTAALTCSIEDRLGAILCCTVCLELPVPRACYQCVNGHLMCEDCLNRILADALLDNRTPTCPSCRCEITDFKPCVRNLAVESAVSEMIVSCDQCAEHVCRASLEHHQREVCSMRCSTVPCRFAPIGCPLKLPNSEIVGHEMSCDFQAKLGEDVMAFLDKQAAEQKQKDPFDLLDLLSAGDTKFLDVKLKPYYDRSILSSLYYQTKRFSAFDEEWKLTAKVVSTHTDPRHTVHRYLAYQLESKTCLDSPVHVRYVVVSSPGSKVEMRSSVNSFTFSDQCTCTDFTDLVMDSAQCNALLAGKYINIRLVMAKLAT